MSSRRIFVVVKLPEDDGEPFEEKMMQLVVESGEQRAEGAQLDAAIAENLMVLGIGDRGHVKPGGFL